MTHKVKYGNTVRDSFSHIKEVLPMPYLLEAQVGSYNKFVTTGIQEVLDDFSPVVDRAGRFELQYLGFSLDGTPKYTIKECKDGERSYTIPLKVRIRLTRVSTGEVMEDDVYMGEIPKMTEAGSFIINGTERVVVSQLVRSPSVYNTFEKDQKTGKPRFSTQIMPHRGAWVEFKQDQSETVSVYVDRRRKFPSTVLIRCLLKEGTDKELKQIFGEEPLLLNTIEKDTTKNIEEAKTELYRKQRPGETITEEGIERLIQGLFFDYKRYDLMRVGRYKVNKKLSYVERVVGLKLAEDAIDENGEVIATKGTEISKEIANNIQNAGIISISVESPLEEEAGKVVKVRGNNTVDLKAIIPDCDPDALGIKEKVYLPALKELQEQFKGEELLEQIKAHVDDLVIKHLTVDDILASYSNNLGLSHGIGATDIIDHLANRRVRCVGELLQQKFREGMTRLDKTIKENMSRTAEDSDYKIQQFLNVRAIAMVIRQFFCTNQLSQVMDHHNPAAELTNKRKLSALGPGGLNRERAGFEVRDINHTHYGRLCPIETPEGQNIGLISSLASYARINEYGFIEAPYRKVVKKEINGVMVPVVTDDVEYLQADDEDKFILAQANTPLNEDGTFVQNRAMCRIKDDIREVNIDKVDYIDVSPKQLISVASALIPFLENDDTARALMGSNMQRQAVPLLRTEAPMIATGIEHKIAYDSGVLAISKFDGVVKFVDSTKIVIATDHGDETVYLQKFERSNAGTCINQKPIVSKGQQVFKGMVLADGPATNNGELSLGRNILIGYTSWEGYNYEDAIIINEDLVKDDVFTSLHIEKFEITSRNTSRGDEQITRDIPGVGEAALRNLDENGIVRIGTAVDSSDILVGRTSPKGEVDLTPQEKLMRAIFGEKGKEVKNSSLCLPHGQSGVVIDVKVYTRKEKDDLPAGVTKLVRVYIAQKRKIGVGDKMSGRHGNKGVISRVLPREDMPFLPDGTRLQIMLNPLGVPSRMNIGQVLEVHLGYIAKKLGMMVATPVFDGATESDIKELFQDERLKSDINLAVDGKHDPKKDGKLTIYDGRTGEPFENPVTVGYMYMLKLCHMVDEKMHARSTGKYTLITQQPLGGKAQFGGQRFGEMEVWALEAYGASHILQEVLTNKSDDVMGRQKAYDAIVKGNPIPEAGTPESFKVVMKEFQALGLEVKVLNDKDEEVGIRDYTDVDTVTTTKRQDSYSTDEPKETISITPHFDIDEDSANFDLGLDFDGADASYNEASDLISNDEDDDAAGISDLLSQFNSSFSDNGSDE
ncbi:MAG: DNA-directed RNA polymerase subunit beta [Clostridia bacterium]|nr:DNA-directed RNA polymerase subunit beta [Clostridia bacterium]